MNKERITNFGLKLLLSGLVLLISIIVFYTLDIYNPSPIEVIIMNIGRIGLSLFVLGSLIMIWLNNFSWWYT